MFGPCKVCAEKDLRIADLKKEIEFLKMLVSPTQSSLPVLSMEENIILGGAGTEEIIPPITPEEFEKAERLERERDAVLSGNY